MRISQYWKLDALILEALVKRANNLEMIDGYLCSKDWVASSALISRRLQYLKKKNLVVLQCKHWHKRMGVIG